MDKYLHVGLETALKIYTTCLISNDLPQNTLPIFNPFHSSQSKIPPSYPVLLPQTSHYKKLQVHPHPPSNMISPTSPQDESWPSGTVRIEEIIRTKTKAGSPNIIPSPTPSPDPNDPLNWSRQRKNWNFALCCFYALIVFALIDATTPTWSPMNLQLGFSYSILNDSYAIGCGTLALSAFLMIPFALKYGRRPVYIVSTMAQLAISIWSAKLQTVADLMLVNALGCAVGALSEVIVQMTVKDLFFVHQRGLMNTIYVWVSSIGATLVPVPAGYITDHQGWRWVWWWNAILFVVCVFLFVFTYEETKFSYGGVCGEGKDSCELKRGDGGVLGMGEKGGLYGVDGEIEEEPRPSTTDVKIDPNIPKKTYWQKLAFTTTSEGGFKKFARHSYQPVIILFTFPAVFYMSWVYGVMNAWSTVMITILSSTMTLPPYNFNPAQIGLMSLPPFIGTTLGSLLIGPVSDRSILLLARRNKGIYEPEMRLWAMAPFIPFVPAGALMYGIALNNGLSWWLVAVGSAVNNFGVAPISSLALTYVTDSYGDIVGDALVGVTFTRNLIGTIFVFALTPWIARVGISNVIITITVIGTVVLAFVFSFIFYGKRFRAITTRRYRYYAGRQLGER